MEGTLAELFVVLNLKDQMSAGLNKSEKGLSSFAAAAGGLAIGFGTLAGALEGPVNSFRELNSAAEVTALQTGNTTETMEGLIEGLHSADTSLKESADLFEALGRAGVDDAQNLEYLGNQFDTLGDSVDESGAKLVETLMPAFKAMKTSIDEVDFDRLSVMFNETGVSADEFGGLIKRLGPSLADAGVEFEDLETVMVGLAEQGVEGRAAMSKLNEIFAANEEAAKAVADAQKDVEKASKELTDAQEKLADANERLLDSQDSYADSADKVADAEDNLAEAKQKLVEVQGDEKSSALDILRAQNDVDKATRDLAASQRDQADAGRGVAEAQQDVGKATTGLSDAEKALITAQNNLTEAQKLGADTNKDGKLSIEEISKAMGVEEEALQKANDKLDESGGKMQEYADARIKSLPAGAEFNYQMENLSIMLGKALEPFSGVIGAVSGFGGAITGIGSSVLILQSIAPALKAMSAGSIITGIQGVSAAVTGLGASMSVSLIPMLIAAAPIIAGIAIGLAAVWALNELGVFKWIIEQGEAFGDWIRNFDLGKAFQGIIDFFVNLPKTIMNALGGGDGSEMAKIIVGILFPPAGILMLLNQFFPQIGEWFGGLAQKVIATLASIDPLAVVQAILNIIFPPARMLEQMGIGVEDIFAWFLDLPNQIMNTLSNIDPNTIVSAILAIIFPPTLILSALGVNWLDVAEWFAELPGNVLDTLTDAAESVSDLINSIFPISDILSGLEDGWNDILDGVSDFASDFIDNISEMADQIVNYILDFAKNVYDGIVGCFNDVAAAVVKPLQDLYDTVYGKLSDLWGYVEGIWDSIVDAFDDIVDRMPFIGGSDEPSSISGSNATESIASSINSVTIDPGSTAGSSGTSVTYTGNIIISGVNSVDEFEHEMSRRIRLGQTYAGVS